MARLSEYPKPTVPPPSEEQLIEALMDLGECETTDGCVVEPDGFCHHGHPSWLIRLGMI